MTKKKDTGRKRSRGADQKAVSRRDFFKKGAAAGLGAALLAAPGRTLAQQAPANGIKWDYDVDVVVCGAGATGLPAAIRARDLGASVLVVDQNFDVGGKLIHSGGGASLGGGDPIQERDRVAADPGKFGLTAPLVPAKDLEDDPDRLFMEVTDWSVTNNAALAPYRYNDREMHRGWADNTVATRQFMLDNYVRFGRINGSQSGAGMTRARGAIAILKLGSVTDIRAGTVSRADAGSVDEERNTPFNPQPNPGPSATAQGAPGWLQGGFCLSRCLEFSAREKGVRFMLHRHMDEIIRDQPTAGRVLGIKASYSPRINPETGERLESYWKNGNVDERTETIHIRARKAVIIGTGGMMGNKVLRMMMDPRLSEPSFQYGDALMGPRNADGSGILAGIRVGATLAGMMQNYQHRHSPQIHAVLGTSARWDALFPGHPTFPFVRSAGINIGNGGWEHLIAVNQVGKRFFSETAFANNIEVDAFYPPGTGGTNKAFVSLDWRNSSVDHIKAAYGRTAAADAALAMNEGSRAPDYSSGPIWAIFDAAAVKRGGWQIRYPYIAEPPNGYFFQADTLAELAKRVMGNPHQKMALRNLEETVAKYNASADSGSDKEFEKPVMHRIDTPPYYAAIIPIAANDSYGGLRINGKAQVIDMNGEVIPGLFAGGEASGGGRQHGIGRAAVFGYIAGTNAVDGLA